MDTFAQDLGLCGIIKESLNILWSQKKTYLQISLALLLPLGILTQVVTILLALIVPISDSSSTATIIVAVIIVLANIAIVVLFLLSVAAIITAAAQAILQAPLHFPSILKRSPRILKKLLVTFLLCFLIVFLLNVVFVGLLFLVLVFVRGSALGIGLLIVLLVVYLIVSLYVSILVNVANVVSVLEEDYGRAAIAKSRSLLRGKEIVAVLVLIIVGLLAGAAQFGLTLAGNVDPDNVVVRVLVGVGSCVVVVVVALLSQVIYTVLYFVCKFRNSEAIDGAVLISHLDGYLGDYAALKSEEPDV